MYPGHTNSCCQNNLKKENFQKLPHEPVTVLKLLTFQLPQFVKRGESLLFLCKTVALWSIAALFVVGCGFNPEDGEAGSQAPASDKLGTVKRALGEPIDGLPTYHERTVHHMTNRIRAGMDCGNPSLVCGGAPVRPLAWNHTVATASHWFAQHLHDAMCFQHNTCCYLENVNGVVQCDSDGYQCSGGQGSCNDNDCDGTSWSGRVSMFGGSTTGENIAAGNSTAGATICQWLNSPGHRTNMCNSSHGSLGTGHYSGSNCYGSYWVQNFASGPPAAGIVSGSHWNDSGTVFGALLYFPGASAPPLTAEVVINGECHAMTRELGDNEIGSYVAEGISLGSGCHAYWFLAEDSEGARYAYPTNGSYLMGSGCGGIYTSDQSGADCEGGTQNCQSGETRSCYTGPDSTQNVGECHEGTQECINGTFGACVGEQLPEAEICDGLDNDCNGVADDPCECTPGEQIPCGSDVGECQEGTQTCNQDGEYGSCEGSVGPSEEYCDGLDNECNGVVDNDCIPLDGGVTDHDSSIAESDASPHHTGDGGTIIQDGGTNTPDGEGFSGTLQGGCSCRHLPGKNNTKVSFGVLAFFLTVFLFLSFFSKLKKTRK